MIAFLHPRFRLCFELRIEGAVISQSPASLPRLSVAMPPAMIDSYPSEPINPDKLFPLYDAQPWYFSATIEKCVHDYGWMQFGTSGPGLSYPYSPLRDSSCAFIHRYCQPSVGTK